MKKCQHKLSTESAQVSTRPVFTGDLVDSHRLRAKIRQKRWVDYFANAGRRYYMMNNEE